ncbi:MAG: O-antigen ligase family protein [bacterium]|nr:O-antigen ligase family protein [bacterium]
MNSKSLNSFYTWGVKILIFIIPFLSLYVSRSLYFPYITGRNFGFRILIEVALVLWLGLILLKPEYRPRSSAMLWGIVGFTFIVGLANIFSVDAYYSFWSRYERMEGYIMILHLLVYFLMASTVLKSKKDWHVFFNIFIAAGLIASFYGILQIFGVLRSIQGGAARVDGTIGNPTYFGAYLLLLLMPALYLFSQSVKKAAKYYYGIVAALFASMIYFTGTRGAMLALIVGIALYTLLYLLFFKPKDKREKLHKKIAAGVMVAVVLLPIAFWLLKDASFVQKNYVLARFANISLTEKTTRSRFMVWDIGLQAVKERPILGLGQENFIYAFSKYYNPDLYDQEPWFDRAHNILVDWLVNAGILGLLSYLLIFVVAIGTIWRLYRKKTLDFAVAALMVVILVSYFVQNLFVFDNFNTYFIFFTILAFIAFLSRPQLEPSKVVREDWRVAAKKVNISVLAMVISAMIIVPVIYIANIKPLKESRAMINVLRSVSGDERPEVVLDRFNDALAYGTFGDLEVGEQFLRLGVQLVDLPSLPAQDKFSFVVAALESGEEFLSKHPSDYRFRLALGNLYNKAAALAASADYLAKAREHLEELVRFSPNRQVFKFSLADSYIIVGDFDKAISILQQAVDLAPKYVTAQVSLGIIAYHGDRLDITDGVFETIMGRDDLDANDGPSLARLAGVYYDAGQLERPVEIYERMVDLNSGVAEYHANLASLYLELGLGEKALAAAKEAARIDPENYQAATEDLLQQISN